MNSRQMEFINLNSDIKCGRRGIIGTTRGGWGRRAQSKISLRRRSLYHLNQYWPKEFH